MSSEGFAEAQPRHAGAATADLILSPMGLRFMGKRFPCTIGKGGISAQKREGDGATPAGTHKIVGMLYRPDRMRTPSPWALPILPGDLWCDDPTDVNYNHLTKAPLTASHEALRRADPLYDLVLITNWNWPHAIPERGSAIFIHRWRRPGHPTEGCIALRPDHLFWIAERITRTSHLIVQL